MNGIKMSDCRFYVDEAARTVVCVVPNTQEMLLTFVQEHFQFKDFNFYDALNFWDGKKFTNSLNMPKSFIGKAVCAEGDEWNEETGRLIAYSRARDKVYKSFFKRANSFVQTVDRRLGDMITEFNDFGARLEDKRDGMQERINEAIGIEEEVE